MLLVRDASRGARVAAAGAVAGVIGGWGVAQWPYLLPQSLTVAAAAAPSGTLGALVVAVVLVILIVLPAMALLYVLDQKHLLPEEGVEDVGDRSPTGPPDEDERRPHSSARGDAGAQPPGDRGRAG